MIRRLIYLNGIAVLSAVLYHASGWGFTAMFWWTDRYLPVSVPNFDQFGSVSYYGLRMVEQLVIFAIPAFLFVSGFFIAFATGRKHHTVPRNIVGVRIKNLLIPYLIWSILIIGVELLQGRGDSALQVLKKLAFGGAAPPYYFVPLLCQLYLLAPFIVPIARNSWKRLLIVTALIQFGAVGLRYVGLLDLQSPLLQQLAGLTPTWFFPANIFWFTFGIVAGFHLTQLKGWVFQIRWGLAAGAVIFFVLGLVEWELLLNWSPLDWLPATETVIDNFYSMTVLLSFIAFESVALPFFKQIGELGPKSFGIYLVHSPVLEFSARVIYHVVPGLLAYQILFQLALVVLGLGVPLLLMALVKRSPARGLYVYLFG